MRRIHTHLARPGLRLATGVVSSSGLPIVGAGTELTHRIINTLLLESVEIIEVDDLGGRVRPWEVVKTAERLCAEQEARFGGVQDEDSRMRLLYDALREVRRSPLGEVHQ